MSVRYESGDKRKNDGSKICTSCVPSVSNEVKANVKGAEVGNAV